MQTLYHGSRVVVEQPEIRIQKFHKDFYWGFYCTSYEQQALRWATRFGKAGVVNVYSFDDQTELKIKRFLEMSDEWELAKFKYPTHQISFHTARALAALKFERSYVANVQEKQ